MEVIESNSVRDCRKKEDTIVNIDLTTSNLPRFQMEILYLKEQGFTNFLLNFDYKNNSKSLSDTFTRIKTNVINLVENHNLKLYFSGFPKVLFTKEILKPKETWRYNKNIFYLESEDESLEYEEIEVNTDKGTLNLRVPVLYNQKFGFDEFIDYPSSWLVEDYQSEIAKIKNNLLKESAEEILKDFQKNNSENLKKIHLVRKFKDTKLEEIRYYCTNLESNRIDNLALLERYFNKKKLKELKVLFEKTNYFTIRFQSTNSGSLKITIVVSLEPLDFEELKSLNLTNLEDRTFLELDSSLEIINKYGCENSIKKDDIKGMIKDYNLDSKKNLLRFLNFCTKPIRNSLIPKSNKGEIEFFIMQEDNNFKTNFLLTLFDIKIKELIQWSLTGLSFKISPDQECVISFFYIPKIRILEEEDIEQIT